ncbi:hypothetical protein HA402_001752 [Bradysia odoriphaga]|nr:hypothetical protein HA402_001752 [Bradysia odoriphaga]
MPPRRPTTTGKSKAPKAVAVDPPSAIQLKFIQAVQRTFGKQHFQQLRLDFEKNFFDPFNKIFMEDVVVSPVDISVRKEGQLFLKEQRFDIFLHFMNKLVSANQFPDTDLIQSVLELILTINRKSDDTYERTSCRIQSAALLFENILDNFPPLWSVCCNVYKQLLFSPFNVEVDFKKIRASSNDGFVIIILALLDDALKDTNNDDDVDESGFDSMMNFQQFEKIESEKCCYMKLTRTEKIDRLFVVLNLLIKLMEIDLLIWIQRYPFQTRSHMSNPNTCPLIAHLLWKGKDCGEMNKMIRDVFSLFTMAVWIEFPHDKTDVLARFVNLIAVSVNLSENCERNNLIEYPNIKRLTDTFAAEMVKSIEGFPYTVAFYTNVIATIRKRTPAVGMFISLRILNKFTKEFENITLRKIFDSISNESYKKYSIKMDVTASCQRKSDKYPCFDPKKDKRPSKHLTINRDEFLTLVLHLFESYIDVYRTPDLLQSLLSDNVDAVNNSNNDHYEAVHGRIANEKNHRLDFDNIVKDWKQLKKNVNDLASSDKIPVAPLAECQSVYLEASEFVRCEEDLEYFLKLNELVEENVELGDSFKKWYTAVTQYFAS